MEVLPSEDDVEGIPPIEDTLRQGAEKRLPPQEDTITKDVTGDGTKDPTTNSKSGHHITLHHITYRNTS